MIKMVKAIKRTGVNYVNPYNFVSIDKTVERAERKTGGLRGIIRCKLETLQPLIIPGKATETNKHKTYTFFSYDGQTPIIPGSSLRGMLRSYFEAVTDSCLSTADNENVLYRRTSDNKTQYGIIEGDGNGGYVMYDAEKLMLNTSKFYKRRHSFGSYDATNGTTGNTQHKHKTGEEVWVRATDRNTYSTNRGVATGLRGVDDLKLKSTTTSCPAGYQEGVVLIGEDYGTSQKGKHHDAVFVYTEQKPAARTNTGKPIAPEDFERLRQVWGLYQPKGKVGKPGLPKGVNQTIRKPEAYQGYLDAAKIPVYYSQVGGIYYLSPACIGKEVFSRTITELLEVNGGHQPCDNKKYPGKKVCPGCALFGMIGSEDVIPSRIQVRDAVPKAGQDELLAAHNMTLPILSGPKITATEFYMEPYPNSEFFNYDYYKHSNGSEALIANPKPRGRKFYWHHHAAQTARQNSGQNATFKPINKGKCFEFEIAFERLNDLELQQLLWVLSFGRYWQQPGSNNYAHKLGHGKPAGYGSVKIDVTEVKLFTIDSQTLQLKSDDGKPNDWNPGDSKSVQELLAMSDYVRAPDNVNYPVGKIPNKNHKNETGIYQWFTLNKGGVGKSKFTDVLPRATDANGNINPALALQGYEQYETENHEPDPQGNIEIVIETFPAVDKTVYSAQNAIHQSQSKPVPVNTIALQADVRRQRAKEEKIIKDLAELSGKIGKKGMPVQVKAAKDKLSAYLQNNPRPDNASQKLAKAYDEAEAKLKQAK